MKILEQILKATAAKRDQEIHSQRIKEALRRKKEARPQKGAK